MSPAGLAVGALAHMPAIAWRCRRRCLADTPGLLQVKRELADARSQLKEEAGKREEAKTALVSEQQYFANKLAELEGMTRGMTPLPASALQSMECGDAVPYACGVLISLPCSGAPSGTPGGQVHDHIQRMKKQLQAVGDGDDIARVAKRTMLTPAASTQPPRPPSRSPLTPKTGLSQPRLGSDASPAHSATPRSGKCVTAQDSAQYWHRRCART